MIEEKAYKALVTNSIAERANKVVPAWSIAFLLSNDDFIVAGGCLAGGEVNDIDIYPVGRPVFDRSEIEGNLDSINATCVYESKNALSIKLADGTKLQFCDYHKDSLLGLISSFDFWHTQCGILYEHKEKFDGGIDNPSVKEIAYTDEWLKFKLTGETHFTSSEFPISSLIRLGKYIKREMFHGRSYIPDVLKIVNNIVNRGFKDYSDFKHQLRAVDLMNLEPEEGEAAWDLFCTCWKRGLVDSKVDPTEVAKEEESKPDENEDYYHLLKK